MATSAFEDQVAAGIAQHEAATGKPVNYVRTIAGVATTVNLTASIGRTVYKLEDRRAARLDFGTRDYLIRAAALVLGGNLTVPRVGDRIVDGSDTFEVQSPNDEPCFRPSDQFGIRLRVHTKKIAP